MSNSNLSQSNLVFANLREAKLSNTIIDDCDLTDGDLTGADLRNASVSKCVLTRTDLRLANLAGLVNWKSVATLKLANIHGVKNPPDGFVNWALSQGAVDMADDIDWDAAANPKPGAPSNRR